MNADKFLSIKSKYSPATRETYRLILSGVSAWCEACQVLPEAITPEQFDEYLSTKTSPSYQRLILSCIKSYLRTMHPDLNAPLMEKESITASPPTEMRTVTKDDAARIVDYLWEHRTRKSYIRTLAMVLLSWEGGLRASECCGLTLGALDLGHCCATVRRKGGRKITTVVFGVPTAVAIEAYLKIRPNTPGEDHVFLSDEQTPLNRNGWRLCLLRLARAAGVEHFSPHALRRGGSVEMMLNGAPDEVIMKLYGWSDAALLSRYTMAAKMERARQWLPTAGLSLPVGFMAEVAA